MIDIFDRVSAIVYEAVQRVAPGAEVCDPNIAAPASFPCVTVLEADNVTTVSIIGDRTKENFARITYQIEVYSNKNDGKRSECKQIMTAINDALIARNFNRIVLTASPNYHDASIYRLSARFQTIADSKNNTYRR